MYLYQTEIPAYDELSVSHLSRVSQANAINSFDSFGSQFIFEQQTSLFHAYNAKYSGSNTGLNLPVFNLKKYLPANDLIVEEPERYLKEHTLYPIHAMFNTKVQQERFVTYFANGGTDDSGFKFAKGGERPILFCLECMNEDLEKYGFVYAHRCHQVLGVYVCSEHNSRLVYSDTHKDAEMYTTMIPKEATGHPDSSLQYQYAVFCRDLLESPVETDIKALEKTVVNTVKDIAFTRINLRYINLAAVDSGLVENTLYEPFSFEFRGAPIDIGYMSADYEVGMNKSLVKLFLIYRTADLFRRAIACNGRLSSEEMARVELNLLTDEYDVQDIQESGRTANLTLRHKECGSFFATTLRKFANGNRCACCNTEPESITEFIHGRTGRHFPLLQEAGSDEFVFDGYDEPLSKKRIVQEINRPVLSPIFGITREDKHRTEQKNRADKLFNSAAIQEQFYEFSVLRSESGDEISRKAIASFLQALPELKDEEPEVVDLLIDRFAKTILYQYVKWINIGKVG